MTISTLVENGWNYISSEKLNRNFSDVMVESMVKNHNKAVLK